VGGQLGGASWLVDGGDPGRARRTGSADRTEPVEDAHTRHGISHES
jgi:hypothetical protein